MLNVSYLPSLHVIGASYVWVLATISRVGSDGGDPNGPVNLDRSCLGPVILDGSVMEDSVPATEHVGNGSVNLDRSCPFLSRLSRAGHTVMGEFRSGTRLATLTFGRGLLVVR